MPVLNTAANVRMGAAQVAAVYAGTAKVWTVPAPPFTPATLPALKLWYDASRLALADGAAVARLDDLSGNGAHAAQATGTLQPICKTGQLPGGRIVRFDGIDDYLVTAALPWQTTHTVALAIRQNRAVPNKDGFATAGLNPSPRVFTFRQQNATLVWGMAHDPTNSQITTATGSAPSQLWHRMIYVRRPGNAEVIVDGAGTGPVAAVAAQATPTSALYVPTGNLTANAGNADLAEFVIYDRDLTAAELAQLDGYLRTKWGL